MSSVSLVFVHDGPDVWQRVFSLLDKHDFSITNVALPSPGSDPPLSAVEDAQVIKTVLDRLIGQEGRDVVIVAHSYAGIPTTNACKDLGKKHRQSINKAGGVLRLVYISAFLLPEGMSVLDAIMGGPNSYCDRSAGYEAALDGEYQNVSAFSRELFYSDLEEKDADYWVSKVRLQPVKTFQTPVSYAAWKDIPLTYLQSKEDNCVPFFLQEQMCTTTQEAGGSVEVKICSASHSPFLSQPKLVADIILEATTRGS